MRSLITGVGGFAGSHLADHLLAQPDNQADDTPRVWGCDRTDQRPPYLAAAVRLVALDLRNPAATLDLLAAAQPDRIYHLAGQAHVGDSWNDPWDTLEANLRSQLNLLEALVRLGQHPRVLVIGSADEYGVVGPGDLPLTEASPLRPDSPYAVSKVGQDLLGLQYHLSHHLPVVRVRPFNHIGPRQSRRFVAANFAAQIAEIEAGRQPPVIHVGNLAARRDFTDVRDMVRGYRLLLERGAPGEVYNLGSGRSVAIADLLRTLLSFAAVPIRIEHDTGRLRPSDLPDLVCDARKAQAQTGWQPVVPLETTLRDLLDYERSCVAAQVAARDH
ncbi:MAG: GDP-mannose 4,6-dehydratase [Anaerolineales bacterium]|nr:GDP-mannose 4,6-dehydratase [Anaerolineales bacterium]